MQKIKAGYGLEIYRGNILAEAYIKWESELCVKIWGWTCGQKGTQAQRPWSQKEHHACLKKQEDSSGESIWLDQDGGVVVLRSPWIWCIFGGKSDRICWLIGHGVWRKERYWILILRHDDTIYWEGEVKGRSTLEREESIRITFWTKVAVRTKVQNVNKKALLQMGLTLTTSSSSWETLDKSLTLIQSADYVIGG